MVNDKTMTTNNIKKELYRQKPLATITGVNKTGIRYETLLNGSKVTFIVPIDEIGDATFLEKMGSQLLIRYIVRSEEVVTNSVGRTDVYIDGELYGSRG